MAGVARKIRSIKGMATRAKAFMTSPYSKMCIYPKGKQQKCPGHCEAVASDRQRVKICYVLRVV
jgi:hypothetical protein